MVWSSHLDAQKRPAIRFNGFDFPRERLIPHMLHHALHVTFLQGWSWVEYFASVDMTTYSHWYDMHLMHLIVYKFTTRILYCNLWMLQGGHRKVSPEPAQRGKTTGSLIASLIHIEQVLLGIGKRNLRCRCSGKKHGFPAWLHPASSESQFWSAQEAQTHVQGKLPISFCIA